jgi:hypothetical protein
MAAMHLRRALGAGVAALLLASGTVFAAAAGPQQRPAGPPPGARAGGPGGDGLPPGELAAMLDTYAIVQAQKALGLDDDQYARFIPAVKRLQEVRRRHQRERNRLIQDLRRMTGPQAPGPPDTTAVADTLRRLREHDEQAAAALRTAYEALDQTLDPVQQARFRVFEETIERRKLDLLLRARQRAAENRDDR